MVHIRCAVLSLSQHSIPCLEVGLSESLIDNLAVFLNIMEKVEKKVYKLTEATQVPVSTT